LPPPSVSLRPKAQPRCSAPSPPPFFDPFSPPPRLCPLPSMPLSLSTAFLRPNRCPHSSGFVPLPGVPRPFPLPSQFPVLTVAPFPVELLMPVLRRLKVSLFDSAKSRSPLHPPSVAPHHLFFHHNRFSWVPLFFTEKSHGRRPPLSVRFSGVKYVYNRRLVPP